MFHNQACIVLSGGRQQIRLHSSSPVPVNPQLSDVICTNYNIQTENNVLII